MILDYFDLSRDEKNNFSLMDSFGKRIGSEENGEKLFKCFLEQFEYAQTLINMVMYRKLNMIDEEKVQIVKKEKN